MYIDDIALCNLAVIVASNYVSHRLAYYVTLFVVDSSGSRSDDIIWCDLVFVSFPEGDISSRIPYILSDIGEPNEYFLYLTCVRVHMGPGNNRFFPLHFLPIFASLFAF